MSSRYARLVGALSIAVFAFAGCAGSTAGTSQPGASTTTTAPDTTAPQAHATAPAAPPTTQPQAATPVATSAAQVAASLASPAASSQTTARFNLNTATAEQFRTIPGVRDRMVREFEEYRPYTSVQQFRREIGKYVSQDQVASYLQYVFVPVDPNGADTETLRQLPGVDASIASQLIAGRPYGSADAFLTKLGQLVSSDQSSAAREYLSTP